MTMNCTQSLDGCYCELRCGRASKFLAGIPFAGSSADNDEIVSHCNPTYLVFLFLSPTAPPTKLDIQTNFVTMGKGQPQSVRSEGINY